MIFVHKKIKKFIRSVFLHDDNYPLTRANCHSTLRNIKSKFLSINYQSIQSIDPAGQDESLQQGSNGEGTQGR